MPRAVLDGIDTRYETAGSGPPLLMFSPGGFDATVESWTSTGIYPRLALVDRLTEHFTCVMFDRREAGASGGRVERIGWADYVRQAVALLDHLRIERAHLLGGCVGCSTAIAVAVAHPRRVASLVLYSPAGGARYRMKQHRRFEEHGAFARGNGLSSVVDLARAGNDTFARQPLLGPWATLLRRDAEFARRYASLDLDRYLLSVTGTARLLFDRDTVPGAEPEDLMLLTAPSLVVPGQDESHATSAARYLQECLPRSQYWDVPVAEQTARTAPSRVLEFLAATPIK